MTLNKLAYEIQKIEHSKGHVWRWENLDRALNLLHDEVSEVSEAWRNNDEIKATMELGDVLVRVLHYLKDCFGGNLNIDAMVSHIVEQNRKRPPHHGRKRNPFESV